MHCPAVVLYKRDAPLPDYAQATNAIQIAIFLRVIQQTGSFDSFIISHCKSYFPPEKKAIAISLRPNLSEKPNEVLHCL